MQLPVEALPNRLELVIDRLAKTGEGIGTVQGRSIFVDGALPGDRALVEISATSKVLRGHLVEVKVPSPDRRPSSCPISDRCGGCDWLHYSDARQTEAKQEIVLSTLEHVAGIRRGEIQVLPTPPSLQSFGYRRRAVMHFKNGKLCFYARRSHHLVEIPRCPALTESLADLPSKMSSHLAEIENEIREVHLLAEADGPLPSRSAPTSLLSSEVESFSTGRGGSKAIALFLTVPSSRRHLELGKRLIDRLEFQGVVIVSKDGHAGCIGDPVLRSRSPFCPKLTLFERPDAFAQANAGANHQLCSAVLKLMEPLASCRVLELFSGNGNLTFPLAQRAPAVWAVEASDVSLALARRTATEGSVQNVRFLQGKADKVCQGLGAEGESFDALLADPPRQGAPSLGRWAKQFKVKKVVYVACDATSLAREASSLHRAGFVGTTLAVVDMFPQTHQLEAAMLFIAPVR